MRFDTFTPMSAIRHCIYVATVAIAMATPFCPAQNPSAIVSIQLDKPLHAVSPTLYGLMTEEINYSYDGGLYAEMVRNRTFRITTSAACCTGASSTWGTRGPQ